MRPKPITRRTILSRRDALTEVERVGGSHAIADFVIQLLAKLGAGSIVALYAPKGTEVDTVGIDAFSRARGLRVAYPRIVGEARRLAFHEVAIEALAPGTFGLREPLASASPVELAE